MGSSSSSTTGGRATSGTLATTGAPTLAEALSALALTGLGVALTVLARRREGERSCHAPAPATAHAVR